MSAYEILISYENEKCKEAHRKHQEKIGRCHYLC